MIIVKIQDLPRVGNSEYARKCDSDEITYLNETGYEVAFITDSKSGGYYLCKGWDCLPSGIFPFSGKKKCGVGNSGNHRHLLRMTNNQGLFYDTSCENYENAYRVNQPGQEGYVIGCPSGLQLYDPFAATSSSVISSSMDLTLVTPILTISDTPSIAPTSVAPDVSPTTPTSVAPDILSTTPTSVVPSASSFVAEQSGDSSEEYSLPTPTSEAALSTSREIQQSNEIIDLSKTSTQLGAGAIVGIVFASIAGFTILTVLVGIAGFALLNLTSKRNTQEYSFTKTTRDVKA